MAHELLFLEFLPQLDLNVILWLNLIAVVIVVVALISAYRKEDITERRFRILSQNYDTFLSQKILEDMEEEDPQRAEEVRAELKKRLGMPEAPPRILMNPDSESPEQVSLARLLYLDRMRKTKDRGAQQS